MYEIRLIEHCDLSEDDLESICLIKSKSWQYGLNEQKGWIRKNLNDSSTHVILSKGDANLGYLNLVAVTAIINGEVRECLGLGNVCVVNKGSGLGGKILRMIDGIIADQDKIGLLFCKKSIVGFYEKYGWKLIEKNKLGERLNNVSFNTMIFNFEHDLISMEYKGANF